MPVRRLNLATEEARRVHARDCTQIRRYDSAQFAKSKVGDLLWIGEPHRFEKTWDADRSTLDILNAHDGAVPIWFDADGAAPSRFGKRRASHVLPRQLSRFALRVTAVRIGPVQTIDEADRAALGLDRTAYARVWNAGRRAAQSFYGGHVTGQWSDNPDVVIVDFTLVDTNIDIHLAERRRADGRAKVPA